MNHKINISCKLSVVAVLFSLTGCTRDINTDVLATYPHLSDVFIDEFASDLQYQAWGKVTKLRVGTYTTNDNKSSIRRAVNHPGDTMGSRS